jgi:16S rRNA (cytosine1402-N4)-methyltransferase
VITFHSGEDRPVKQRFALLARDCVCDPKPPVCRCGWHPQVRLPRRNGWTAGPAELARNPRARSARLRVAVRNDLPLLPLPS